MTAVAVVLAAGSARRFGATKQLADLAGRPLIAHVVDAALRADLDRVVVVVGHDGDRVGRAVPDDARVVVVPNPDHAAGMATSLRTGIGVLEGDVAVDVAVILLADQPGLDPDAIAAVVATVRGGALAARAVYHDGPGHPVAFARPAFAPLKAVRGDRGARDLLAGLDVVGVAVPTSAPPDVDTPADLPTAPAVEPQPPPPGDTTADPPTGPAAEPRPPPHVGTMTDPPPAGE